MHDLAIAPSKAAEAAVLYRPLDAGDAFPLHVAVRFNGDISSGGSRVRAIAGAVDPTLRIDQVQTLAQVASMDRIAVDFFVRIGAGIAIIALMLSTAGVYALLSFTVARRTPEIAIRLALGANARRVVLSTFSRALLQVGLGVVVGCIPGAAIVGSLEAGALSGSQLNVAIGTALGVIAFMAVVTIAACYAPARRAMRIQPADALKAT
jgi:ABC-type antimicrobial peptide transport system permease subunit